MTTNIFLISPPGAFEIIIIVVIIVLLFGGRKIPELMRGLGQGMKEFKKASRGDSEEETKKSDKEKELDK